MGTGSPTRCSAAAHLTWCWPAAATATSTSPGRTPGTTLFLRRLASFCRLILFDRRGTGPSDALPPDPLPPWESYAEELAAVLDEVGSQRAAIMAQLDAGPTALLFAGTRPERTSALVLVHTSARFAADSDYPIGGHP